MRTGKAHFPYVSDWWRGTAAAAKLKGNTEQRRQALETLVQIEADDPGPRKALAELAISESNFEAAYKFAKLTLHIDVLDADVHRILAEAAKGLKDYKLAIQEYEVAVDLKSKDTELRLGLAEALMLANRSSDAKKLIDDILKEDAANARAKELKSRIK